MATRKLNFLSIVLLGRHNPQILNHAFLVHNEVLPKEKPFFREDLKEGESPFTSFISTPPVTQIAYEMYSLQVQDDRYQAIDATGNDPARSPIIGITEKYFGRLLRYTPLQVGGMNLNFDVAIDSGEEAEAIDSAIGIDYARAKAAFAADSLVADIAATFGFLNGRMSVASAKPADGKSVAKVHFNYEFKYSNNIDTFLSNLRSVGELVEYCRRFFGRIGVKDE